MKIEQYGIYYINLDPTVGKEVTKKRPCIIITPTDLNEAFGTSIIAPITSTKREYPTRVKIEVGNTTGYIMLDQLRTVDSQRIVKKFDRVTDTKLLSEIKVILKGLLDLD